MRTKSMLLLVIATAFLSLMACKKDVNAGGAGGGKSIDPLLVGEWRWYSYYTRVFDDAGTEYNTPPPFHYGSDDYVCTFKDNGTYNTATDDGLFIPGTWSIKNGKFVQDGAEYEYSLSNNNQTLILKKIVYFENNGTKYRRDEYTTLIRN